MKWAWRSTSEDFTKFISSGLSANIIHVCWPGQVISIHKMFSFTHNCRYFKLGEIFLVQDKGSFNIYLPQLGLYMLRQVRSWFHGYNHPTGIKSEDYNLGDRKSDLKYFIWKSTEFPPQNVEVSDSLFPRKFTARACYNIPFRSDGQSQILRILQNQCEP